MDAVQNGLFPRGLSIGLAHGTRTDSSGNVVVGYPAIVNFDATRSKGGFKVLSHVPLLAQNNREASVSIVNNIPIRKSTITGTGATRDVIQNIDRIDVGIKLKLTPHVSSSGDVRMLLNPSIEAIIDSGGASDSLAPTIAHREVLTTVSVPDGRTIVLSGLIREDQTEQTRRVPILGYLPLVGWLFRHTSTGTERTNLLIFVTPRVVKDYEDLRKVTETWRDQSALPVTNLVKTAPAPAVR